MQKTKSTHTEFDQTATKEEKNDVKKNFMEEKNPN